MTRIRAEDLARATPEERWKAEFDRRRFVAATDLLRLGLIAVGLPVAAGWFVDPTAWRRLPEEAVAAVFQWERERPLEPGFPRAALAQQLGLPSEERLDAVIARTALLSEVGRISADPFRAPDVPELRAMRMGPVEQAAAERAGRVLLVARDAVLSPLALDAPRDLREALRLRTAAGYCSGLSCAWKLARLRRPDDVTTSWTGETGVAGWLDLPDDPEAMLDKSEQLGWGDGLPFIPPTRERIDRMLLMSGIDPEVELDHVSPSGSQVTAAKVAANAVMAGCRPAVFPVVWAALGAVLTPGFNHEGMNSTTHPTAPLVVVHGPIVAKAGFNAGTGTLGPGNRSNATVGRAMRLCLLNIGHARHGDGDYATHASPAKYAYCMAENSQESPWTPYYVEAGIDPDQSAVTVMGAEGPHHVNDHVSQTAEALLATVGSMVTVKGSNPTWLTNVQTMIVLGPEHAATVAKSGFSRRDAQIWLYENARMPLKWYKTGAMWGMQIWPAWKNAIVDDEQLICPLNSPDEFRILVSGGPGKSSAVIPGDGMTRCWTVPIPGH